MADVIYFVIPCYNEEEVLPLTAGILGAKLKALTDGGLADKNSRILFVDDGSADKTWRLIEELSASSPVFTGIKLSHNRGHQNALMAGLMTAKDMADAVISMDADLQDDINAADAFLKNYYEGCDIVYGVRKSREKDTFFKRFTAEQFYKGMKHMGVELVFNHADYRLMSKKALECLSGYNEVNLFLRGIVPQIGLKYAYVEYERGERAAGESKYPLKKMLAFAADGVTSFSVKPLGLITMLGTVVSLLSVFALAYALIAKALGAAISGWTSLVCSLWLLGGIELLSLGVIGTYIGKIYAEVKNRPKYFIEKDAGLQMAGTAGVALNPCVTKGVRCS